MNCSAVLAPNLAFTSETLAIVVCYSAVFFIAFVGNSVMFLILFRNQLNRRRRRRVHLLLLHMTVAHLLVTLIYMPKEIIHNVTVGWWGGDFLCRICKFFDVFGVVLSAGILMCLSLDRFNSILFPLYVMNAKRSVSRMLIIAWVVSIVSSMPQLYIFRAAEHPCFKWYSQCVSADVIGQISPTVTFWFSVINIIQVYFIPLIVIILCYGSILISISLKTRENSAPIKTTSTPPPSIQSPVLECSPTTNLLASARKKAHSLSAITIPFNSIQLKTTIRKSGSNSICQSPNNNTTLSMATTLRRTGGSDSFQKAKNRTLKMTVVLVLAFLLCWTPYTVAMFIHFLWNASGSQVRPISPLLSKFLYAFAVFNSAISPYLYGYFSFNIREELKYLGICLRGGGYSFDVRPATTKQSMTTTCNNITNDAISQCQNCTTATKAKKNRSQSVTVKESTKCTPYKEKRNLSTATTTLPSYYCQKINAHSTQSCGKTGSVCCGTNAEFVKHVHYENNNFAVNVQNGTQKGFLKNSNNSTTTKILSNYETLPKSEEDFPCGGSETEQLQLLFETNSDVPLLSKKSC